MTASIAEQIAWLRAFTGDDAHFVDETAKQRRVFLRAILATLSQRERAMAVIRSIRLRAGTDGSRTFDDLIRDIGWIDDECRAVLAALDAETEVGSRL